MTAIGICIALFSGIVFAIIAVLLKKLSTKKVHYSVINLYASFFSLPYSFLIALAIVVTGYDHQKTTEIDIATYGYEFLYALFSGISG